MSAPADTGARVRAERDRALRYLDLACMPVLVLDRDGRVELLNGAGHELLGHPPGALVGADFFATCVPECDRELQRAIFAGLIAGDADPRPGGREVRLLTAGGEIRTVSLVTTVLRDEEGRVTGTLDCGTDVSERHREITHLAYHDALTGLPNRALLQEHLELALARAERRGLAVALLYLDLDDFKRVNDTLGHAAGDDVLRRVADRLGRRVRASDLVARQGGDEFLVLLADLDRAGADAAARAAAAAVSAELDAPFEVGGAEFQLGASIGIALWPGDAADAGGLLQHADAAMYQAKAAGRGRIVRYARDAGPVERLSLPARLRRAVDDGELLLHWQPIVALGTGRVVAAEALLRWRHPERGLLDAGQFVGFAEETGLIDRLGTWVAGAVQEQRARWRADGLAPAVHLNVSPRELARPGHAAGLIACLGADGLEPAGVTVEIAESPVLHDERSAAAQAVRELDAAGVRIALDDFGGPHSSLGTLRHLPVDVVKVGRAVLGGIPQDPAAATFAVAALRFAAELGVEAVACGVETDEQRALLEQQGWPCAQGRLLGAPAPAAELAARLRRDAVQAH